MSMQRPGTGQSNMSGDSALTADLLTGQEVSHAYLLSRSVYHAKEVAKKFDGKMTDHTCVSDLGNRWTRRRKEIDALSRITPIRLRQYPRPRPPATARSGYRKPHRKRKGPVRGYNGETSRRLVSGPGGERTDFDLYCGDEAFLPSLDQAIEDYLASDPGTSEREIRHDRMWNSPDTVANIQRHCRDASKFQMPQFSNRFNRPQPPLTDSVIDKLRTQSVPIAYDMAKAFNKTFEEAGGKGFKKSVTKYYNDPQHILARLYGPGGSSKASYMNDKSSPMQRKLHKTQRDARSPFIPKSCRTKHNTTGDVQGKVYEDWKESRQGAHTETNDFPNAAWTHDSYMTGDTTRGPAQLNVLINDVNSDLSQ